MGEGNAECYHSIRSKNRRPAGIALDSTAGRDSQTRSPKAMPCPSTEDTTRECDI
jgi:hypothetical protein